MSISPVAAGVAVGVGVGTDVGGSGAFVGVGVAAGWTGRGVSATLAAGDEAIRSMDDLVLYVSQRDVGDQVTFLVLRDGEEIEATATLAARPDSPRP